MAKPHEDRGTMPGTKVPPRTPKVRCSISGAMGWRDGSGLVTVMGQVQLGPAPDQDRQERTPSVQAPMLITEGRFQPKPNCVSSAATLMTASNRKATVTNAIQVVQCRCDGPPLPLRGINGNDETLDLVNEKYLEIGKK